MKLLGGQSQLFNDTASIASGSYGNPTSFNNSRSFTSDPYENPTPFNNSPSITRDSKTTRNQEEARNSRV